MFQGIDFREMRRITPSQWSVLIFMEQRRELSLKEVAEALRITSSAATQLINRLVENNHVVRKEHAKDRRAVSLSLSRKARNAVEKMKRHAVLQFLAIFGTLTGAEFDRYCALTEKIVAQFVRKSRPNSA